MLRSMANARTFGWKACVEVSLFGFSFRFSLPRRGAISQQSRQVQVLRLRCSICKADLPYNRSRSGGKTSTFDWRFQKDLSFGIASGSNECGSFSHCARFALSLSLSLAISTKPTPPPV